MFPFISFIATIFLQQVSVAFYRGLLGQKWHAAFRASSWDEVTPATSWKPGLSSEGIRSCINQMSVFSMMGTKVNSNPRVDWGLPNEQALLLSVCGSGVLFWDKWLL